MLAIASERTLSEPRRGQRPSRLDHRSALCPIHSTGAGIGAIWSTSWNSGRTTLTTAEVQAIFDRHGVPSSPYRTVKEAMADPQLAHRHAFAEIADAGGSFLALNPPFRLSAAAVAAQPFAAALGEHTERGAGRTRLHPGRDRRAGRRVMPGARRQPGDQPWRSRASRVTTAAPAALSRTRLTVCANSGEPE